ncbi:MAG: O-antigen ligase family protein [Desulfuromonadales bacterium]|nr:O-antigen ligase family protein [Desulfuromonadales bacterium]
MQPAAAAMPGTGPELDRLASKPLDFPAASRIGVFLFCIYVVIWYLQMGNRIAFLGAIRFEFIFAVILSLLALIATSKERLGSPLYGYILLLFLAMAVQLPFSHAPGISWTIFLDRVVKFAFMGAFIVMFVRSPSALTLFLGAFLLACMKMGQEGLFGKLTGSMMWQNQGTMRLHGSTALYRHPNSFSGMALGTLPFVLALWPIANRTVRILLFILFVLSLNIIIFTGSRTGYVGFTILLLYAFWKSANKMRYLLIGAAAVLLALPMVPHEYFERFESIFTQQEKEGQSAETRIQILKDGVAVLAKNPLGVGLAAFPQVRMETFGRFQDSHNLYLQVALDLGIQGLIIFLLLLYRAIRLLKSVSADLGGQIARVGALVDNRSPPKKDEPIRRHLDNLLLMRATADAVMLFLVVRLALGLFGHDLYEIYWWFALGLIIALANMNKTASQQTARLVGS